VGSKNEYLLRLRRKEDESPKSCLWKLTKEAGGGGGDRGGKRGAQEEEREAIWGGGHLLLRAGRTGE